ACSRARGQGTCTQRGSIRRAPLEELILGGLRHQLMAPELVEEFVAAYHEEVRAMEVNSSRPKSLLFQGALA
ncbi:MAG TPA: hypothetical protein VFZ10_03660, partial [Geminicoccaceae bacterium]